MPDVKDAIRIAKNYVQALYVDDEAISNLGLEEVEYDPSASAWRVTLSFSRPFSTPATRAKEILDRIGAGPQLRRSNKVVTVDDDGNIVSMRDRSREDALG